jgi:hypothetical protein
MRHPCSISFHGISGLLSGSSSEAWPEILSAFKTLGIGDPKDFYDAIILCYHFFDDL